MDYQTLYLLPGDVASISRGSQKIKIETDLAIRVSIFIEPDMSFEGIPSAELQKVDCYEK